MRYKCIGGLALLWMFSYGIALAEQTVYRYEPYESGQRPPNVTPADPVASLPETRGVISRGAAEGPFQPTLFGVFRSGSVYVFEGGVETPSLQNAFTVEAYLRITETGREGVRMIVGNEPVGGGAGFALELDGGRPVGRFWTGAEMAHSVRADEMLETGRWYRLVYRYVYDGFEDRHVQDIWIDDREVAGESIAGAGPRAISIEAPAAGAARGATTPYESWLDADVMAVQLHDYPLSNFFLASRLIRDGSAYFGLPAYHNYLGLDGEAGGEPLERRMVATYFASGGTLKYGAFEQLTVDRWILPLINDGYIVQGMAGDPENHRLFLSMYHGTVDGVSYTFPSVVVELFSRTGQLGRVFVLHDEAGQPLPSHVGGVAYWDGLLLVPGPPRSTTRDPDVLIYDISSLPEGTFDPDSLEGFSAMNVNATWKLRDPIGTLLGDEDRFTSISFMGIHLNADQDRVLHLGNFQSSSPAPVHLFRLDLVQGQPPALTYLQTHLESHRRTQSVHYYFDAAVSSQRVWKTFQATSYGNNDSHLYTDLYLETRDAPYSSEFAAMPAGLEEVFSINGRLWVTSESGSLYYQKRSNPWTDLYPFLSVLDANGVVDINGNGFMDQWEAKYALSGTLDPSGDLDGDGFSLQSEYDWDTDPLNREDFPWISLTQDFAGLTLSSSLERFYTLQESTDVRNWQAVPGWIHRRGSGTDESMSTGDFSPGKFFRILVENE